MRIDEMILKANKDGKTYISYGMGPCGSPNNEYSKAKGFIPALVSRVPFNWEEKPKRHLTVSEVEKELDCVIDVNCKNLSLRSPKDLPKPYRNVVVLYKISKDSEYTGYCNKHGSWFASGEDGSTQIPEPLCWIDPDDILKLLPKG